MLGASAIAVMATAAVGVKVSEMKQATVKSEIQAQKHVAKASSNFAKDTKYFLADGLGAKAVKKVIRRANGDMVETDTSYVKPENAFYWAGNDEGRGYLGIIAPAYTEMTWVNNSDCVFNADREDEFTWVYYDVNSPIVETEEGLEQEASEANTKNLTMFPDATRPGYINYGPTLFINGADYGHQADQYLLYGGKIGDITGSGYEYKNDVTNPFSDAVNNYYALGQYTTIGSPTTPTAEDLDAHFQTAVDRRYKDDAGNPTFTNVMATAWAQFIPAQGVPIVLYSVRVRAGIQGQKDVNITLNIRSAETREIVATSKATFTPETSLSSYARLDFPFSTVDKETGLEEDGVVLPGDGAYWIEISTMDLDPALEVIYVPVYMYMEDAVEKWGQADAYVRLEGQYNGSAANMYFNLANFLYYATDEKDPELLEQPISFDMNLDMEYPFIVTDGDDYGNVYTTEDLQAGGDVSIDVATYKGCDEWDVTDENGDELPSWVSFEAKDYVDDEEGAFIGYSNIALTVEPMPSSLTSRKCEIHIKFKGAEYVIKVNQGESGVEDLKADNANVSVAGGNFVINAANGETSANIYNIAGQLVKTAELNEGVTVVDGSDLGRGAYIVRLNSGKAAKVAK